VLPPVFTQPAELLTSSESTQGNRSLPARHIAPVTHLDATPTKFPAKCCKQKAYRNANSFRCTTYTKRGGGGPREPISYLPFDFPLSIDDPNHVGTVNLRCPALQDHRPQITPAILPS